MLQNNKRPLKVNVRALWLSTLININSSGNVN